MKKLIIKIFFIFLFISVPILGQNKNINLTNNRAPDSIFVMKKSPWGAVLRSAILPGWGQFYNHSYWKIPVIWGGTAALIYGWVDRNNLTVKYRDLYNQSLIQDPQGNSGLKELREFYKNQRNAFAVFIGLTYFLNLVDAYVDAHLFDFDVTDDNLIHQPEFRIRFKF
ncbi:hypothetical protein BMS3Abin04_01387 [bacterium BMS3Abin04]|nr:hypothetical protein BMS3Abin04_01387 [bacterium BMS3Abin04]